MSKKLGFGRSLTQATRHTASILALVFLLCITIFEKVSNLSLPGSNRTCHEVHRAHSPFSTFAQLATRRAYSQEALPSRIANSESRIEQRLVRRIRNFPKQFAANTPTLDLTTLLKLVPGYCASQNCGTTPRPPIAIGPWQSVPKTRSQAMCTTTLKTCQTYVARIRETQSPSLPRSCALKRIASIPPRVKSIRRPDLSEVTCFQSARLSRGLRITKVHQISRTLRALCPSAKGGAAERSCLESH